MSSSEPWALETPEALDRALRLVHARGGGEVYWGELAKVLAEVDDEDEHAMYGLVHALARVASVSVTLVAAIDRSSKAATLVRIEETLSKEAADG
jgi:hypothetical protein